MKALYTEDCKMLMKKKLNKTKIRQKLNKTKNRITFCIHGLEDLQLLKCPYYQVI